MSTPSIPETGVPLPPRGDRGDRRDRYDRSDPTPGRRLRLLPADPDGEQLALALEWEVSPGVAAEPAVPADLHIVRSAGDEDQAADTATLPEPGRWVAQLARAIAEVSVGERPVAQLTRWVSRDELARLGRRAAIVARHPSARVQRGVTRLRTVRSVRVCPVAPGVVETSAVLVGTERSSAIAIRLEAVQGRWLATAIEMR